MMTKTEYKQEENEECEQEEEDEQRWKPGVDWDCFS